MSFYVLLHNLKAEVYSPDADTILIPIMDNAITSVLIVALIIGCILCTRRNKVVSSIGFFLGFTAILFSASYAWHWAVPNHYLIAISFGVILAVAISFTFFVVRGLASNHSFKADVAEATRP